MRKEPSMAQLYTLPLAGENEVFSIYGLRDLDGNGTLEDRHSGWDIRPPKVGGRVPEFTAQAPAAGAVDWVQTWDGHTKTGSQSYGNACRVKTPEGVYVYAAHMTAREVTKGQTVAGGQVLGQYGAKTTGNSGGPHVHIEMRAGGTSTAKRACPGEFFGIANTKDVVYHRERMEVATVGLLTCTKANYRWREGAGTDWPLFKDKNNGAQMYCRVGVIYRVYATATVAGQLWCQVTPPAGCITKGKAPALWVSAACGSYQPKAEPAKPEPGPGPVDWDSAGNDFVVTASAGDRAELREVCERLGLPVKNA